MGFRHLSNTARAMLSAICSRHRGQRFQQLHLCSRAICLYSTGHNEPWKQCVESTQILRARHLSSSSSSDSVNAHACFSRHIAIARSRILPLLYIYANARLTDRFPFQQFIDFRFLTYTSNYSLSACDWK